MAGNKKDDLEDAFDFDDNPFGEGGEVNLDDFPDASEFGDDFPDVPGEEPSAEEEEEDAFADLGGEEASLGDEDASEDFDLTENSSEEGLEWDVDEEEELPADAGDLEEEGDTNEPETLVDKLKRQAIPLAAATVCLSFVGYAGFSMIAPAFTGGTASPQAQFTPQAPPQAPQQAPQAQTPPAQQTPPQAPQQAPQAQTPPAQQAPEQPAPPPVDATAQGPVTPSGLPTGPADSGVPGSEEAPAGPPGMADGFPSMDQGAPDLAMGEAHPQQDFDILEPDFDGVGFEEEDEIASASPVAHEPEVSREDLEQFVSRNDLSEIVTEAMETSLDTRFNQVLDAVDMVSTDVSLLMGSFQEFASRLDVVTDDVDELRDEVSAIDGKVEAYIFKVDSLEDRLASLSINGNVRAAASDEEPAVDEGQDGGPALSLPSSSPKAEEKTQTKVAEATPEQAEPAKKPAARSQASRSQPSAQAPRKSSQQSRQARGGNLAPPGKPMVVQGYHLKGVSRGLAWIDNGYGVVQAGVGQSVDGLGRVHRISRGQGDWMVVTDAGIVLP